MANKGLPRLLPPPTSFIEQTAQNLLYTSLLSDYCNCTHSKRSVGDTNQNSQISFEVKQPLVSIDLFSHFSFKETTPILPEQSQNVRNVKFKSMIDHKELAHNVQKSNLGKIHSEDNIIIQESKQDNAYLSKSNLFLKKYSEHDKTGSELAVNCIGEKRSARSEEIKEANFDIKNKTIKLIRKNSEQSDLNDDEEWTYRAPKYYNVKESSVSALDSYKYVTIYKHNKRTNRTVRYFVCQYEN